MQRYINVVIMLVVIVVITGVDVDFSEKGVKLCAPTLSNVRAKLELVAEIKLFFVSVMILPISA